MDAIIQALEALKSTWIGVAAILMVVISQIVTAASVIVKLTKTQKDDEALSKFIRLMRLLGLYT